MRFSRLRLGLLGIAGSVTATAPGTTVVAGPRHRGSSGISTRPARAPGATPPDHGICRTLSLPQLEEVARE